MAKKHSKKQGKKRGKSHRKSPGGRYHFPTSEKDALKLFRLLGDLADLADGDDDVDEGDALTRTWLRQLLASGATPNPAAIERAAAGDGGCAEGGEGAPAASADTDAVAVDEAASVSWQAVARALKAQESSGPLTAATVASAMATLGLQRAPKREAEAGCLIFGRGRQRVGVRLYQLGSIRVAEIAVGARKKGGALESGGTILAGADDAHDTALVPGGAGTYVAGSIISEAAWDDILDAVLDTLERAQVALADAGKGDAVPELPTSFEAFKAFIAEGKDEDDRAEDQVESAEIGRLQAKIQATWLQLHAEGRAPSAVLLQYDGPDGAGKTSSSKYIPAALSAAQEALDAASGPTWTTRTEIFKAPTDADKAAMAGDAGAPFGLPTWLARHVTRGMPATHEILIKDRYQPGDFVYVGSHDAARCAQMAAENARYEALLAEKNVLIFQAILFADRHKQAKTFGKRMARGVVVDAFMAELRRRGALTAEDEASLVAVKNKVRSADFVGFSRFDEVLPLYRQYAAATGTPVIDATDRHAARLALLERFLAALVGFGG